MMSQRPASEAGRHPVGIVVLPGVKKKLKPGSGRDEWTK
jgi:hypothetical protein